MQIDSKILDEDFAIFDTEEGIKVKLESMVPFAVVDEVPVFPGCENEEDKRVCFHQMIQKHISKNFRYPKKAQELGIQGRVNTMFTIDENGAITNLRMRGPDSLLENEVSRIISKLPKMIPGKHSGEAMNVPFSIPITFKLNGKESDNENIKVVFDHGKNRVYIIDGIESSKDKFESLNENNIESILF